MVRSGLMWTLVLLSLFSLTLQAAMSGQDSAKLESEEVAISEILERADYYNGTDVVVEGTIATECSSGCWFFLDDETASIYVDILPSNFVIPQKRGEDARVYGTVVIKEGDPMIIGKMVKIGGEIYQ